MRSPYEGLSPKNFWSLGVAAPAGADLSALYTRKFAIGANTRVMTAGSCFAQHIGAQLRQRGFHVIDTEPAPPGLAPKRAKPFGYGLYSARYGNIYTARQLDQLLQEALDGVRAGEIAWEKAGRYYDALRPAVEPDGLATPDEVHAHRAHHLRKVRAAVEQADVLVFTLGLTEAWEGVATGQVFPTAPGVVAGRYDPAAYRFVNFGFNAVHADFLAARTRLQAIRPGLKFILTVSPVPLTATAGPDHVLAATIYSKSVLRAVAGQLAGDLDDVDYFPSYEIVSTPFLRQNLYERNLRTVKDSGVAQVMEVFFAAHRLDAAASTAARPRRAGRRAEAPATPEDLACEEALLDAFAR